MVVGDGTKPRRHARIWCPYARSPFPLPVTRYGKEAGDTRQKCKTELRPDDTRSCHTMMQMPMSPGMEGDWDYRCRQMRGGGHGRVPNHQCLSIFGPLQASGSSQASPKMEPPFGRTTPVSTSAQDAMSPAPTLRCAHPTWLTCHKCGRALLQNR